MKEIKTTLGKTSLGIEKKFINLLKKDNFILTEINKKFKKEIFLKYKKEIKNENFSLVKEEKFILQIIFSPTILSKENMSSLAIDIYINNIEVYYLGEYPNEWRNISKKNNLKEEIKSRSSRTILDYINKIEKIK